MKKSLAVLLVAIMVSLLFGRVNLAVAKEMFNAQGEFYDMAQQDNKIVAVGYEGVIAISEDSGDTWSSVERFCSTTLRQVIWAKDRFIVVNVGGEIYSSVDGYEWTLIKGKVNPLLDVIWNGEIYVAVGAYGCILLSEDGEDWKPVINNYKMNINSIEWNGEYFLVVGNEGFSAKSYDGLSWEEYSTGTSSDLVNITWANNRFFAMGQRGSLLSSKDGKDWKVNKINTNGTLWELIWNGNEYVVLGIGFNELSGVVYGSTDGETWGLIATDGMVNLFCGIYSGGAYVLGGGTWGKGELLRVTLPNIGLIEDEQPIIPDDEIISLDKEIKYKQIEAGRFFTLAIDEDGTVWSWGYNEFGTLGNNTFEDQISPVKVIGVKDVVAVSSGTNHCLALTSDGKVYSWGNNRNGELGDGTYTNRNTASLVVELNDVVAISAGGNFSLALKKDGTVWGWGSNSSGELANKDLKVKKDNNSNKPIQIPGLTDVIAISAADYYSIALIRDNTVWAWGSNYWVDRSYEVPYVNQENIIKLDCDNIESIQSGNVFSVLLSKTGDVYAFGSNFCGQLGNENINNNSASSSLSQVKGISNVEAIYAGENYVIAKKADNTYWGWGDNGTFQLAEDFEEKITAPIQLQFRSVNKITNIKSVSCGFTHVAILQEDGTVKTKGHNDNGQLGLGNRLFCSFFMDIARPSLYAMEPKLQTQMSSWAMMPIDILWSRKYINQDLLSEFKAPVTRGEFAGLIIHYYMNYIDLTLTPSSENPFKDIDNHKYRDSIIKAYNMGVIRGTSLDTFEPDKTITRQEIAVMLYNLMKVVNLNRVVLVNEQKFIDNQKIAKWARQPINFLYTNNIMAGVSHKEIRPLAYVTREQALVLLYRFIEVAKYLP